MKKMIGDHIFGPKNEGNVGLIGSDYYSDGQIRERITKPEIVHSYPCVQV